MKFETNNYVLFKYLEEWQEGRVLEVISGGDTIEEKRYYRIISFKTYTEVPSLISENIFSSTLENLRKLKVTPLYEHFDSAHIPLEIRDIIRNNLINADSGILPNIPARVVVSTVVKGFGDFILINKPSILPEEINEMLSGFNHCFNTLIVKSLLLEGETKALSRIKEKNAPPADIWGVEYLLRMILLLEKKILPRVKDGETRGIIFEYLTYMLDYLNLNREKYFV